MSNKSIVIEYVTPPTPTTVPHPERPEHFRVVIEPRDPITVCTIYQQHEPLIDGFWEIAAFGISHRRGGDIYDRETGCRLALASAMRRLKKRDRHIKAHIWRRYLEMFPVEKRVSQAALLEKKLIKALSAAIEFNPEYFKAMLRHNCAFAVRPIHRTWRFGENTRSNGNHHPMIELKY